MQTIFCWMKRKYQNNILLHKTTLLQKRKDTKMDNFAQKIQKNGKIINNLKTLLYLLAI